MAALGWLELAGASALVLFMVVSICAEVFYRYALGSSLIWVEEAATVAFIWVTLIGAAVAAKARRHICITTFGDRLPRRTGILLDLLGQGLVVAVAATTCAFALSYTAVQGTTSTVSLPINFPRSWVFSWPLVLCMASIALTYVVYFVDSAIRFSDPAASDRGLPIMEP